MSVGCAHTAELLELSEADAGVEAVAVHPREQARNQPLRVRHVLARARGEVTHRVGDDEAEAAEDDLEVVNDDDLLEQATLSKSNMLDESLRFDDFFFSFLNFNDDEA